LIYPVSARFAVPQLRGDSSVDADSLGVEGNRGLVTTKDINDLAKGATLLE
jgi:hypothetical protein